MSTEAILNQSEPNVILTAHATKVNRTEPNWTEPQTCLACQNHALINCFLRGLGLHPFLQLCFALLCFALVSVWFIFFVFMDRQKSKSVSCVCVFVSNSLCWQDFTPAVKGAHPWLDIHWRTSLKNYRIGFLLQCALSDILQMTGIFT